MPDDSNINSFNAHNHPIMYIYQQPQFTGDEDTEGRRLGHVQCYKPAVTGVDLCLGWIFAASREAWAWQAGRQHPVGVTGL